MNYGFNDEKEKVEMYAKNEAYSSVVPLLGTGWVIHRLFEEELLICTNRTTVQGIPSGGEAPPTEIPANSTEIGRIALPSEFSDIYDSENDCYEGINISITDHSSDTNTGIGINDLNPIDQIVGTYYLYLVCTNKNNYAVGFPNIDICIHARNYHSMPGPV